ncbi:MAG: hypothetical protein ACJA2G_003042, partial [Cognaticolwellia sp.]
NQSNEYKVQQDVLIPFLTENVQSAEGSWRQYKI